MAGLLMVGLFLLPSTVMAQSPGGARPFTSAVPGNVAKSIGQYKILYIPATFLDRYDMPITQAEAQGAMREVVEFYAASSYGQLTILPTVCPGVVLPHSAAWHEQRDAAVGVNGDMDSRRVLHADARAAARKLGYDSNAFDLTIVRQDSELTNNASTNEGILWLGSNDASTAAHEIGHTLGLNHANAWSTSGTSVSGPGADEEYGHVFDRMALYTVPFPEGQFNVVAKSQLGWLPSSAVRRITSSGTYRIDAMDTGRLEAGRGYAMQIVKDVQRSYWAEARSLFDSNPWAAKGVVLQWSFPQGGTSNAQLLDTTPGSPFGMADSPLSVGRTFSDREAGIHLTTLAVNESPRWMEVRVNVGAFPGNHAPSASMTASSEAVPVGATVTFSVTASDADGDEMAYGWQHFGDAGAIMVSPNAAVITRSFTTAGSFVVSCTVSDMKGGTCTRSKVITVGGGNGRKIIRGRISQAGNGVGEVVVMANGANGVISDSDGYFAIPNLPASTYVVTPQRHGMAFREQFTNPVVLGSDYLGANFTATTLPEVTLSSLTPSTSETVGSVPARFRLGRSGTSVGELTVNVNAMQGSATVTTDYALTPTLTTGTPFNTLTIPNGQPHVDVDVTAVDDATAEGTETATMELASGFGYTFTTAAATVEVNDDDTTQQRVSVSFARSYVGEGEGTAELVFRRSGSTAADRTVTYTVSGSASSGADFSVLSGTALIPATAATVTVPLTITHDTAAEIAESVIVTVSSSVTVFPDTQAGAATLWIQDDDAPVVSITSTDASATEGADTGTFVISRSGDASQAVTVYYAVSGEAMQGADYQALTGSVTLLAGAAQASIAITAIADGVGEGPETLMLRLASAPDRYSLSTSSSATMMLNDAPTDLPTVGITAMNPMVESSSSGVFTLTARGGTGTINARFQVSGTATVSTDYSISGLNTTTLEGTVTLPLTGGSLSAADIVVSVIGDAVAEELETITLTLLPDPSYQAAATAASATLIIVDNDKPAVFVDAQVGTGQTVSTTVTENSASSKRFYFSRTGSTASALAVNYTITGTATNGTDYSTLSGSVTIPAGSAGELVAVTLTNDSVAEGTETIVITPTPSASYASGPAAVMTITDNDASTQLASFNGTSSAPLESAGTISVPVSLTTPATAATSVEYAIDTLPSTDRPHWVRIVRTGTDFWFYNSADGVTWSDPLRSTALPNSIPSTAYLVGLCVGSDVTGSTCTAVMDNVSITGLDVGGTRSGSATHADVGTPSPAGSSSISADNVYTLSGGGPGLAPYGTADADALRMVTYTVSNSANCTLTARVVSLTGGSTNAKAGVMIRSSNVANVRQASVTAVGGTGTSYNYRTSTGGTSNGLVKPATITLIGANSIPAAFGNGLDYTLAPGVLNFAIGEQTKQILVPLSNDSAWEVPESFAVSLFNPSSASLGTVTKHVVTIQDDDAPPALPAVAFASAISSVSESAGTAEALVSLTAASTGTVTVNYALTGGSATSGVDFTLSSGTLSFAVGETVKAIPIAITSDAAIESNETITLSLSSPTGATLGGITAHTATITDDDTPVVSIVATDADAAESGDGASFTISRTGPTTSALNVIIAFSGSATNGADYAYVVTPITIAAGDSATVVSIMPMQDVLNEGTESVVITVQPDSAYVLGPTSEAQATIADDDRSILTLAATDATASEAGDSGQFTLTRTGSTAGALTVNLSVSGTASAVTDYAALPGSVVFADAQSVATLDIQPTNDAVLDADEVVLLSLAAGDYAIGTPSHAGVTITDNDAAPVVQIVNPTTHGQIIASGNGLIVGANVADDALPQPVSLVWSKVSGPGAVTFDDATSASTGASFSMTGTYVLRVTATDGQFVSTDDLAVTVDDGSAGDWQLRTVGSATIPSPTVSDSAGTIILGGTGSADGINNDGGLERVVVDPTLSNWFSRGAFYSRTFVGDFEATVLHGAATSTATGARSGLMVRSSTDGYAAYAHVGRINQAAYDSFLWRTTDSGSRDGLPANIGTQRWLRLVRQGNSITAYQAPNVSGSPGAWVQISMPQTVLLPQETLVGLFVDNKRGSGLNTVTFTNLTIAPLNRAPTISIAALPAYPLSPVSLDGGVSDDGYPSPATLTSLWTKRSGPGTAIFNSPSAFDTIATLSQFGSYTLRLQAEDTGVQTFRDLSFTAHVNAFQVWQSQNFLGGPTDPIAAMLDDPDHDGVQNLAEYAFGSDPHSASVSGVSHDTATIGPDKFLRLTVSKNPTALGITYSVEATSELANPLSWSSAGLVIEADNASTLQVRDVVPMSAGTPRFMRVRITLP